MSSCCAEERPKQEGFVVAAAAPVVGGSSDEVKEYPLPPTGQGVAPQDSDEGAAAAALSKKEAKRLIKEQKKESQRVFMKERRREKKKEKLLRRQEAMRKMLEEMTVEERVVYIERKRDAGRERKANEVASLQQAYDSGRPRVAINCSFSDTMSFKEQTSLAKQAQMAFVAVRDTRSLLQLHFTSVNAENPALRALENIGIRGWHVHVHEESCWNLFDLAEVVVLTPDAEEDLEEVRQDRVYVIGGIVDRSVTKRQSLQQALDRGAVCCRRLPIKRHGPMGAHPVLNIDVVVRILVEQSRRDDWPGVLADCLPYRHSGQPTARMLRMRKRRLYNSQAGEQDASDSEDRSNSESCSVSGSAAEEDERKDVEAKDQRD